MSETRAHYEKILFVRLPPFIGDTRHHPRESTFPFRIAYAATITEQKGWRVAVLDAWAEGLSLLQSLRRIRSESPDILVLEADAPTTLVVLQCAQEIKESGHPKVVICGPAPTFSPHTLLGRDSPIDAGMVGEYEETAVELFEAFRQCRSLSEIAGIVYWDEGTAGLVSTPARPLIEDLDALPTIDYGLFDLKRYYVYSMPAPLFRPVRWGPAFASRGCPYPCTHCSFEHRQSFGKRVRVVSPKKVVDEIELLVRKYGVNAVSFEDDCFSLKRDHVFALCDELEERRLRVKWFVETRVDLVDRELVRRMKRAGCFGFNLGIESGSDRVLKALRKGYTRQQILDNVKMLSEEGMRMRLMFMFGNPGEMVEDIEQSISLAMQAKAITVQAHLCTPYPGTTLAEEISDVRQRLADFSSFDTIAYNLSKVSDEEIFALQKSFYYRYYFSWHYLKVFARHRLPYMLGSGYRDISLIFKVLYYLVSSY